MAKYDNDCGGVKIAKLVQKPKSTTSGKSKSTKPPAEKKKK